MSKKIARGRKTKFGEPLVSYSIMIRRDQREYLQERENASDWVREAIDEKIERESGEVKAVDVVAVSKRITFLEQRIEVLKKMPEHKRAKDILETFTPERFKQMQEQLTKGEVIMTFRFISDVVWLMWGGRLLFGPECPIPGWTAETLPEFLYKHKLVTSAHEEIPSEYALMIINKMEEAFPYEVKLIEGYEKRIAQLQTEIGKLKEKITQ